LLNIVKLRYVDTPIFVDVGQIVAGYTLEAAANAGGQLSSERAIQGNSLTVGGAGRFTDRPTITYTPLTGNKFIRSLMTPLPPTMVFFTVQGGWPADSVLAASVASINGLKNQSATIEGVTPADPDFLRVLELLRKIQLSGAVAIRVQQANAQQDATVLSFRSKDIEPETLDQIKEMRQLLRLDPDAQEFKLVFGATPANDREIAVVTRSLLHIMSMMSVQVEVPEEDIAAGRAPPGAAISTLRIHSSAHKPQDAFVAVQYRDRWFWIDDRDMRTKRAFAYMMLLFTLADTSDREPLPLITIPAQ
jgi:hypothetical protein